MASLLFPKAKPHRLVKARQRRTEAETKRTVRMVVTLRDGYCRLYKTRLGPCDGISTWAHLGPWRRFKTRGVRDPTVRHHATGTLKLCRAHHRAYDAHRLTIEMLSLFGAEGRLRFVMGTETYEG